MLFLLDETRLALLRRWKNWIPTVSKGTVNRVNTIFFFFFDETRLALLCRWKNWIPTVSKGTVNSVNTIFFLLDETRLALLRR